MEKWEDIMAAMKVLSQNNPSLFVSTWMSLQLTLQKKYENALQDVVLQYTWPRIDAEVSKHRNHLLKSPFCVHPSTGRVCVPVNPSLVDEFDPATVPTVGELLAELSHLPAENGDDAQGRRSEGELEVVGSSWQIMSRQS